MDFYAAEVANKIILSAGRKAITGADLDKRVTSAMNILAGQGIYAMFLWLCENDYEYIINPLDAFFHKAENPLMIRNQLPGHEACLELTSSLKRVFLCKQLLELILTYARHMAKANKGQEK